MADFIRTPMINANEDVVMIVEWFRKKGDRVSKGELLALLETTKSTFELQAESSGYFVPLVPAGEQVRVGKVIAAITGKAKEDIIIPAEAEPAAGGKEDDAASGRQYTKKAELLARRHKIDLAALMSIQGAGAVITEKDVREAIAAMESKVLPTGGSVNVNRTQRFLILGGGNIAVLVMDILSRIPSQSAVGILDDNPQLHGTTVMGCPVLGNLDECIRLWKNGFFEYLTLAIGVLPLRYQLYDRFSREGIPFGNIVDPTASVLSDVMMGTGNLVMGYCRIGPQAVIGNNNFLSAFINLEHHNHLGNHCTFGPGVFTSGGVRIGSRVRFGTGVFIEPRLTIGNDVTIASGVVLTTNVPEGVVVRARTNFQFYDPGKQASGRKE